ncbi:hypothetical protein BD626DRAFT_78431 [Schizophyllum amplum]|uniref:Uncharacterized protein n=1 Tax=Schizophyllum amplum TaxID=97359 RepID=A0A550C9L3_9AGAR|nr:hypothetical protein BD626DRAFT_78431 [Auriculariopsis ampla]
MSRARARRWRSDTICLLTCHARCGRAGGNKTEMIQFGVHADDGSPNFACLSFSLRFAGAVSEPVSYKCSTPVPGAGCCVVAENVRCPYGVRFGCLTPPPHTGRSSPKRIAGQDTRKRKCRARRGREPRREGQPGIRRRSHCLRCQCHVKAVNSGWTSRWIRGA